MRFIKIVLCYCCIYFGHLSNGINIKTSEIRTRLMKDTMELIEKEFTDNSNPLIITSDLVDHNVVRNDVENESPLIVIDSDFENEIIEGYISSKPTYILTIESFDSFQKLLPTFIKFLRSSIWNVKSLFFILEISKEPHYFVASVILRFLWINFDIMNGYVLSYDKNKDSTVIYTLNPFTEYAPRPWNQVINDPFKNETTKSTLYSLQYPKELKKNNQNVYFDKTQRLDGHHIKILATMNSVNETLQKQKQIDNYRKLMEKTKDNRLYSLPDYLNVTTSYQFENHFNVIMAIAGFDFDIIARKYDIRDQSAQLADINYKFTDFVTEYQEIQYSIITKKSDYLTVIGEVNVNFYFIIITIVVLLLIALIIAINNNFHLSEAIMDIASMIMGMGIMTPMARLSMKIIYFFGFLFIFVVMPEFQGQISAILSKPARRNVETFQDLVDNKYHVFFDKSLLKDIAGANLSISKEVAKYLHPSNKLELQNCAVEAQKNPTIACIDSTLSQLERSLKLENLHVSKESAFKKYYVRWTKKHWSLKDKIDKVRSIPVETGLTYYYNEKRIQQLRKKIKKMEKTKEAENYERIEFESLVFYFIMIGAILLWSLIIFGIELVIYYRYTRYKREMEARRQFIARLRAQPRIIFFPGRMVLSNSHE